MRSMMESPPKPPMTASTPDPFLHKLALDAGQINVEVPVPARPLKVLVGTWNVGNKMPPATADGLSAWIPQHGGDYDVIAIGLQESSFRKPSSKSELHDKDGKEDKYESDDEDEDNEEVDAAKEAPVDAAKETPVDAAKEAPAEASKEAPPPLIKSASSKRSMVSHYAFFHQLEHHVGPSYVVAGSVELMEIRLIVFVHERNAVTDVEKTTEATGVGNVIGNKGGAVLKLTVDGLSLCFVNCHLAAHEAQKFLDRRNSDCAEILNGARVGLKSLSIDHQFDHAFWFGDMNYRINLEYGGGDALAKDAHWDAVHALVMAKDFATLYANDQLQHQLAEGKALAGWSTAPCDFPPTFKRVRGRETEFTRQRVPSYCDRILWTSLPGYASHLKLLKYACVETISTSDHKPVFGAFELARYAPTPPTTARPHQSIEVQFSNVAASNLLAMDITGTSDPYIKFYCPIAGMLVDDEPGKHHPQSGIVKASVNPEWTDDQLPTLKLRARLHELQKVHLVLVLMDYDATSADDALGEVVLCLQDLYSPDGPVAFERPVILNGVATGILRGAATVSPSDKGLASWEKPSEAVPGCSCAAM
ncbi:phosphatidylinositol-3,4,5-trisphosphate 5-phosphatase [Achlya hypogyna]|uniref:Phosphatidylinositol-3,4,5-trisphosphate 5-phosphatase n=1 Tax=Achlya hypogyna TaxID=1202772 RepID=A0A1V9ZKW6_ACHHY|nr:phosphatidylinositol-3,4,5-trisphosphate 5-phosphatase [Achlya hypogyna]